MRLLKRGESQLVPMDELIFEGEQNALIKFSRDGNLFAYFLQKKQCIRVINYHSKFKDKKHKRGTVDESSTINLIEMIKSAMKKPKKFHVCYGRNPNERSEEQHDLSFIKHLEFD